jgi:hypothetical protein
MQEGRELRPSFIVILHAAMIQAAFPFALMLGVPLWMRLAGQNASGPPPWLLIGLVSVVGLLHGSFALLARRRMEKRITLLDDGIEVDGRFGVRTLRFEDIAAAHEMDQRWWGGTRWKIRTKDSFSTTVHTVGLVSKEQASLRAYLVEHLGPRVTRD